MHITVRYYYGATTLLNKAMKITKINYEFNQMIRKQTDDTFPDLLELGKTKVSLCHMFGGGLYYSKYIIS